MTSSAPCQPDPLRSLRRRAFQSAIIGLAALLSAGPGSFAAGRPAPARTPLTLRECVAIALEGNFQIRLSRLDYANANADLEIARALYDPALSLRATTAESVSDVSSSQLDGSQAPQNKAGSTSFGIEQHLGSGADVSFRNNANRLENNSEFALINPSYDAGYQLSLRQPLLRGAGLHVNRIPLLQSEIAIGSSDQRVRKSILATLQAVESAYWELSLAHLESAISQSNMAISEQLLEEVKVRVSAGLSTGVDQLRAETTLAGQRETAILTRQNEAFRVDNLLQLLGQTRFDTLPVSTAQTLPLFGAPSANPDTELLRAQAADPDYRLAVQAVALEKLSVEGARNRLLPSLDLVASGSYSGLSGELSEAYQHATNGNGYDWSIGLEVRIPWGFREERARLRQARNGQQAAEIHLAEAVQTLTLAVRAACRSLQAAHERVVAARATSTLSEDQFVQIKAQFDQGLVEFRDVLEAQNGRASAKVGYLRARLAAIRADLELSRLNGTLLSRHGLAFKSTPPLRR